VGETVIHEALPPDAVNGTGPPVVVRINVCVAGGFGGVLKFSVAALKTRVGGGASTVNVTGMLKVFENPAAANWMIALYVPIGNPLGLTRMLIAAGNVPALGVMMIHCVPSGATTVV
jgi:hypothetical protein